MWYYFTVVDSYTGLDRDLRWREVVCGCCGGDCQLQLYDGVCGRWIPVRFFFGVGDGFKCCRDFDFEDFYRTYAERFV